MDYKLEWAPAALDDVDAIAKFIARDSEYYASSVVNKILRVSRQLCEFPFIGRIVPELDDISIRERFIYSYRLIYHIGKNKITVIAVIHGKRMFDAISTRFDE